MRRKRALTKRAHRRAPIKKSDENKTSRSKDTDKQDSEKASRRKKSSRRTSAAKAIFSRRSTRKKRSSREKEPIVTTELVEQVISDVNAGTSVPTIAEKQGIKEDLAAQICRLYVTHQGIDAEGVLRKMSL